MEIKMLNNLLFAVAVLPSFLCGDMKGLRSDLHFKLYDELVSKHNYGTSDYWISVGRAQAFSEIIIIIDLDLLHADPL